MKNKRRFIKTIAMMLTLVMCVASIPAAYVSAAENDSNVITVGNGGDYKTLVDAIAGVGADALDGKTLKLVSDVSDKKPTFSFSKDVNVTIDGDGHTLTLNPAIIVSSSSGMANVTFKNVNAKYAGASTSDHPFVYARGNSNVVIENCSTDESFAHAFCLNNAGNCHLTINSGSFVASKRVIKGDFGNHGKPRSSITINGGYFLLANNTNAGSVIGIGGLTDLDINGGVFITTVVNPIITEAEVKSGSANVINATIDGATFIYPKTTEILFAYEKVLGNGKTPLNFGAGNSFYAASDSTSKGTPFVPTGDVAATDFSAQPTAQTVTAKLTLSDKTEFELGDALIEKLDSHCFDGAVLTLTADSAANVDFATADITVDKNGFKGNGITSSGSATIKDGINGLKVYMQLDKKGIAETTEKVRVRLLLPVMLEERLSAGILFTQAEELGTNDKLVRGYTDDRITRVASTKYYKAIWADSEYELASYFNAERFLIAEVGEFAGTDFDKPIYARFYSKDANGVVTYTDVIKIVLAEHCTVGRVDLGEFDVDDGHTLKLERGVTKAEFDAHCAEIESKGFVINFQNEVNNNFFKTYYKQSTKEMIHTYWVDSSKEMRTISAVTDKLPINSTSGDNNKCKAQLHQLMAISGEDGGMGYIIRLNDGRFIIFDGGGNSKKNVQDIYDYLKSAAPDPNNVVIASWYISHGHGDHYGAFDGFADKYAEDPTITLETVMFNPCDNVQTTTHAGKLATQVEKILRDHYPNVPVYKPLAGQIYTFSKTSIHILWTCADYMPTVIPPEPSGSGNSNTQTMPCLVDIVNDKDLNDRFFCMGDMTTPACDEICDRYGSWIECDYVSVSHHGLCIADYTTPYRRNNSTKEIYTLINATYALWPSTQKKVDERMQGEVNKHLVTIVEKVYVAGNGANTFEFE